MQKENVLWVNHGDIASEHPEVRDIIMKRLSVIAKEGEVITVVHDVQ